MPYVYTLPKSQSFVGQGLSGYTFGPLSQKDLEIYFIDVEKGHDVFMISKRITRTYYVLSGAGYFTIAGNKYDVNSGMLVEIPPNIEYCYSGTMKLLGLSKPRWFSANDQFTKWNPDVVGKDLPIAVENSSWLTRWARFTIGGRSPMRGYLRLNQRLWDTLPSFASNCGVIRSYGNFLHALARAQGGRSQALATLFFRNRPALELARRLVGNIGTGGTLRITVLGCSTGAEVYSLAWRIRSARSDLNLSMNAVDISKEAIEFAERGVYSNGKSELTGTKICECMTSSEINELFDQEGGAFKIKPWINEGIHWHVGNAGSSELVNRLGSQDMVVANNFLCHMRPLEAEGCLRNIAHLVAPGGYLFVSGIDLDVRTKVARDLEWQPVEELLEEIHDGDPYLRRYWPSQYAGLEPLDKRRPDWRIRYAAVFRLLPKTILLPTSGRNEANHANVPQQTNPQDPEKVAT